MSFKHCFLLTFLTVYLFSSTTPAETFSSTPPAETCGIEIINNRNIKKGLWVEIADSKIKQNEGLMYRKSIQKNHGMIFVFKDERIITVWMKNTYIPLSLAYISKEGIINEIYHMEPLDITKISSNKPAQFALEVNRGWFKENNITKGSRILFNGCIGK